MFVLGLMGRLYTSLSLPMLVYAPVYKPQHEHIHRLWINLWIKYDQSNKKPPVTAGGSVFSYPRKNLVVVLLVPTQARE